jgi:hypothetical protein
MKSLILTLSLLSAFNSIAVAQDTVYKSNFSQGSDSGTIVPGVNMNWSTPHQTPMDSCPDCWDLIQTDTAPLDNRIFLGQFGEQEVTLSLAELPSHDSISIAFDFYAINTWDGNINDTVADNASPDIFALDVDGTDTLIYATFTNNPGIGEFQSFPSNYPLNGNNPTNNPPGTGALTTNQLGFPDTDGMESWGFGPEDAEYHLTYTFANSNDSVKFNFLGGMLNPGSPLSDESWGLDSVIVSIGTRPEIVLSPAATTSATIIVSIIPNPAHDVFTLSFTNPSASPIHYEIDDVLGRVLTSGETSGSQLSLSARDLPEGVLFLRASSNGFVQTRRFVVAR